MKKIFFCAFTYVMLLQQAVEGWQVLNNELAENPLVSLDTQQGGGEIGWRKEVFNQSTHHPQHIFLFKKEEKTGNHLDMGVGRRNKRRWKTKIKCNEKDFVMRYNRCLCF